MVEFSYSFRGEPSFVPLCLLSVGVSGSNQNKICPQLETQLTVLSRG